MQASLTTSNTGACAIVSAGQGLQFSVYSGAVYNPASMCTNYVGDPGIATSEFGTPPPTSTMYFNVPAGAQYTVVVYELTSSAGVGGCAYTLVIAGAPICAAGAPLSLMSFEAE